MACDYATTQLVLYLDGALPPAEAQAMATHLQTCPVCQEEAALYHRLQALLRLPLPEDHVPPHLWPSLQARLAREVPDESVVPLPVVHRRRWPRLGVLAALVVLTVALVFWRFAAVSPVVHELVESQIRSRLMATPYQALPAEATVIRGWFADKVEFPVRVPPLAPEHYAFLGARVNYFLDRRVAEMVYTAGGHTVTFVMFADQDLTLAALPTLYLGSRTLYVDTHKGYTTVLWKDRGVICGLVSDLPRTALVDTLQKAMPSRAGS